MRISSRRRRLSSPTKKQSKWKTKVRSGFGTGLCVCLPGKGFRNSGKRKRNPFCPRPTSPVKKEPAANPAKRSAAESEEIVDKKGQVPTRIPRPPRARIQRSESGPKSEEITDKKGQVPTRIPRPPRARIQRSESGPKSEEIPNIAQFAARRRETERCWEFLSWWTIQDLNL